MESGKFLNVDQCRGAFGTAVLIPLESGKFLNTMHWQTCKVALGLNPFGVREVSKRGVEVFADLVEVLIPLESGKFLNRSLQIFLIQINDLYFKFC